MLHLTNQNDPRPHLSSPRWRRIHSNKAARPGRRPKEFWNVQCRKRVNVENATNKPSPWSAVFGQPFYTVYFLYCLPTGKMLFGPRGVCCSILSGHWEKSACCHVAHSLSSWYYTLKCRNTFILFGWGDTLTVLHHGNQAVDSIPGLTQSKTTNWSI